MNDTNGQRPKPRMDINLLTPNAYRRLRARLDERDLDLDTLLGPGAKAEDTIQALTLGFKLRDDPEFTWDAAGDISPSEVFDMSGEGREPDPPTVPVGSSGLEPATKPASGSKPKRRAPAAGPS